MKRKPVFIQTFIILLSAGTLSAQSGIPFREIFDYRGSSARTEALGMAATSLGGETSCIWNNPAGLSEIDGFRFSSNYGYSRISENSGLQFWGFENFYQANFSAACKIKSRWVIAAGSNTFGNYSETNFITTTDSITYKPQLTDYTGSVAYNLWKGLSAGVSFHYYHGDYPAPDKTSGFAADFGLRYHTKTQKGKSLWKSSFAAVAKNFTSSKMNFEFPESLGFPVFSTEMPFYFRLGSTVSWLYGDEAAKYKPVGVMLTCEAGMPLNYNYDRSIRGGIEVSVFETLHLRSGYQYFTVNDYGYPTYNRNSVSSFSFGAGLDVPLSKITGKEYPFNIRLDYSFREQPNFIYREQTLNNQQAGLVFNYKFGN